MGDIKGGIIAAGHGERFQNRGIQTPKALLPVAGRTLLERTIDQFVNAGINDLTIIFNEHNAEPCTHLIRERFPDLKPDIIVKTTASSFESFCQVSGRAGPDPMLITTIDSIYQPGLLKRLLETAQSFPPGTLVLGITSFIDDEKPLYVEIDSDRKILSLGGDKAGFATSGIYFIPSLSPDFDKNYSALRFFLIDLVRSGAPAYGFDSGPCVDVDRPEDLGAAEDLISTFL